MKRFLLFAAALLAADVAPAAEPEIAVFAGGCFWCLEEDFSRVTGVLSTETGYTGGRHANPRYGEVAAGRSDQIFAVRVVFDPDMVTYPQLIDVFWDEIDPTDAGGQFCERGGQYRAVIFSRGPDQAQAAEAARAALAARLQRPLAVELRPATRFWPAESEHQGYAWSNPKRYEFFRRSCRGR